jgi:uncharacterized protein (UPF0261 family)
MPTVVLLGTLDTKGVEHAFLRERLEQAGCEVIVVNVGVLGDPGYHVDFDRAAVARAAEADLEAMERARDRGAAVTTMARGAAAIVAELHAEGRLHGIIGAGGSGGSSIISSAMQALPVGVPKVLVSTMASGDVRPYMGAVDIAMMYSVVDIAGVNAVSAQILSNAAAAVAGMAQSYQRFSPTVEDKPLVGATMWGTTTPCVDQARKWLESAGYEVLVFHATGAGGRSMEALMRSGHITASLDITTTELIDELAGGTMSAGPDRLEAAGDMGLPQVVSLGGADQIAFAPPGSMPAEYANRAHYSHNPTVTTVRTSVDENIQFGRLVAEKLNRATGPLTVFIPLRGTTQYSAPGEVFNDPEADEALFSTLRANLDPGIEVIEMDTDINDPEFGLAMARRLDELYRSWAQRRHRPESGEEGVTGRDALVTGSLRD